MGGALPGLLSDFKKAVEMTPSATKIRPETGREAKAAICSVVASQPGRTAGDPRPATPASPTPINASRIPAAPVAEPILSHVRAVIRCDHRSGKPPVCMSDRVFLT